MDVLEIDASNNGVDSVRVLVTTQFYARHGQKYACIIDEVHMLSPAALLKNY